MGYYAPSDMPEQSGDIQTDIQRLWEYVKTLKDEIEFIINKGGKSGE